MPDLSLDAVAWWTLKGSVIALIAFASARLLRNAPAAVRHAIWTIAVAAQLAVPFAGKLVPEKRFDVSVPAVARFIPAPPAASAVAAAEEPRPSRPDAARVIQAILAFGALAFLLRLALGTLRVILIASRSERVVDGEWLALVQQYSASMGISRPVTLMWSERVPLPVTWGFVYPVILLPVAARTWPAELRRHVLVHELAHIKRSDALTQLFGQCALALFWFNPLLWLAVRNMRAEAENASDDYVLREGERPSQYALTLVALVHSHRRTVMPAFASLAVARRSELEERVSAITHPRRDVSIRRALFAGTVVAMLLVVLPLSAIQRAVAAATEEARPNHTTNEIACKPLYLPDAQFRETSGTLTLDGVTTHYFLLRPAPNRCIEASFPLETRFTDDDRDVVPDADMDMLVREKLGDLDRAVYATKDGRRYLVNGRAAAWDANAESWYRQLMPEIVRRTSAGVAARAARIVDREGERGLVAELGHIDNVSLRRSYLEELLALRSKAELPRTEIIAIARDQLASFEPELANFLAAMINREGSDVALRDAVVNATGFLRSPQDRLTVLTAMAAHPDREARRHALYALSLMPSDASRREFLTRIAPSFIGASGEQLDAYFDAVAKVRKPSEQRALLAALRTFESPPGFAARLESASASVH